MKFGVHLTRSGSSPGDISTVELAGEAEALGFHSVWVGDHVVSPKYVHTVNPHAPGSSLVTEQAGGLSDPFILLSYIGALTKRVRLGFDVLVAPYRPPLPSAKQIATLDSLSCGRVVVGIGAGWHEQEFNALGIPFKERGPRTDEAIAIWKRVWTGENVDFRGRFSRFEALQVLPAPAQQGGPPIWVGGDSPKARRRAAEIGDGWNPTFNSVGRYRREYSEICRKAASLGRKPPTAGLQQRIRILDRAEDPGTLDPTFAYHPIAGTPDQVIAALRAYDEIGVSEIIVSHVGHDSNELGRLVRRFGEDVLPAFSDSSK